MTVSTEVPTPDPTPITVENRMSLRERLTNNPVVLKELRGRMRGNRAFIVLTVFLVLMGGFALLLYSSYALSSNDVYGPNGQLVGKIVFGGLVGIELFLVTFIAPALTTGAISGERERQTFDLLRTTLLPASSLVLGKLISALSYVVLLLFAAVPLQSLAFLLGGVAAEELWISLVVLLVTALAFGSVGIFFSSMMKRTLGASVLTYAFALLTTLGLPILMIMMLPFLDSFFYSSGGPGAVMEGIIMVVFWLLMSINPLATAIGTEVLLVEEQTAFYYPYTLNSGITLPLVSPWILYTIFYLFFSLLLIFFSILLVRRKDK